MGKRFTTAIHKRKQAITIHGKEVNIIINY